MKPDASRLRLWLVIAGLSGLAGTAVSRTAETAPGDNGPLLVHSSDRPIAGCDTLDLEESWRIGGEAGEAVFKWIEDVASGPCGEIHVLDGGLARIDIYSSWGERIRSLDLSGEGPGEIDHPLAMLLLPDSTIGLIGPHPSRIVRVDAQGVPRPSLGLVTITLAPITSVEFARCRAGVLLIAAADLYGSGLLEISAHGTETCSYAYRAADSDPGRGRIRETDGYFLDYRPWDIGPDGRIYVAPRWNAPQKDRYSIDVYRQRTLERIIDRPYAARRRSTAEKQETRARILGGAGFGDWELLIEDYAPDVRRLWVDPDGRIRVETSRSAEDQASGIFKTYDVFDPAGRFEKQTAIRLDAHRLKDELYFIDSERVILVKGNYDALHPGLDPDPDPIEIICYTFGDWSQANIDHRR